MIISTIGSCRVAGPMTKVQAQRNFVLDNRLLYGYTHNTKETIQAIRYMRGELTIPEAAWKFLSDQPYRASNPLRSRESVPKEDRHVVEISSIKVLEYRDTYLQLVRFKDALSFCPELRKIFFDHPGADAREARLAALQATPSFSRVPANVQDVLRETVLRTQTATEIESDLKQIAQILGQHFVLVTHCNAMNAQNQLIADRAKMVERVSRAASRAGITLVDPGALLAAYGQERGMPEDGRDTAHYTPAFARLVGKEIADKLLGVQEAAAVPAGEEGLTWKQCIERAKETAQAQEWDRALLYANRAIDLKSTISAAYVLRARAVTALEQTDDMLEAWTAALNIQANRNGYIMRQAAEAAMVVGDLPQALEWATDSLALETEEKTALLLGRIHARLGQNKEAERAFRVCAEQSPERALRYAVRGTTALEEAASMVNALAAANSVEAGALQGAREQVLKRASREVRHTGRAGAALPTPGAFFALLTLAGERLAEFNDEINQAYRRLLKAFETVADYQQSEQAISLLGQLAAIKAVDPRYVQRAAKALQATGHRAAAVQCWQRLANSELPGERETVLLAAGRLSQLEAHTQAADVYRRLAQSGTVPTSQAHEMIERNLRALARAVRKHLTEGNLREAEQELEAIKRIDPGYPGLTSLQRSLVDAHRREFQSQREQGSTSAADLEASARRVIETNPRDRDANIELVMQSLRNGNLTESRRILDRFLEGTPA
ncbi:capsular biosynthesis protein [Bordetella genomosp. 1]|uniref:Capsular biosynthesis protein n=2 Tax=Bordetella genomosp. 1 TaxID=1395607 RepID=A0A261SH82_9BORD|nr:capsular biosynthesis protein [Bordetella genomosp. 1]